MTTGKTKERSSGGKSSKQYEKGAHKYKDTDEQREQRKLCNRTTYPDRNINE
jgi:hypothetical protein